MKLNIANSLTRTFHRTIFQVKKHSPEILIVTGVVGVVASAVMACKATLKVNDVLTEAKEDISKIHECAERGCTPAGEDYTVEDSKKELTMVYARTGVQFVKLYGPSLALGALSIGGILTSNNILRKRSVALAAAYTAVDKSFKEYRGRVVERFGEDLDRELKYNIKAKKIDDVVVDEETGKEKKVKKTVEVATIDDFSPYYRFYDDGCKGWTKDPQKNLTFLKQVQSYANDLLQIRGHLFLNEVYDMLGIPHSSAGQLVGWIYDEKNPHGANYVDFGLCNIYREKTRDFVNGIENVIILDFNVDEGEIYRLI